jgi:transcriptional regulator with XRE-family HTH domain
MGRWMAAAEQGGFMSPRGETPLLELRRLRGRLRLVRETMKLTQRDVTEALDWSTSKLICIENSAMAEISVADLKTLLLHCNITAKDEVDQLVATVRASKRSAWWQEYRNTTSPQFLNFLGLEASAIRIRQYQGLVFPGLAQARRYASELTPINARDQEDARLNVEIRLRRQDLITADDAVEAFFILDESVLHRQIGDVAVMREQFLTLKEMATRPNIAIHVMPYSAGVHRGMKGSFEVLELSDEPDDYALLIEGAYRDQLILDPNDETREFVQIFFELEKVALPVAETLRLIDTRLEELDNES